MDDILEVRIVILLDETQHQACEPHSLDVRGEFVMEEKKEEEVDVLCPECGNAFKIYMDRVLVDNKGPDEPIEGSCPVCGCGECKIGR